MIWFFLVNDQRDAQLFSMYLFLFIFLTLYMFRAYRAHHQERQIVSIHPLVAVGGCVVCRSEVKFRPAHDTATDTVTATGGCIDTICLSWWWARYARNMYRVKNINKYIEEIVRHVGHLPRIITWCIVNKISKTCPKRTPYIPETWTNGKWISELSYFPCKIIL